MARIATRWAVLGRRANNVNFSLSVAGKVSDFFGRPVRKWASLQKLNLSLREANYFCNEFMTQNTSVSGQVRLWSGSMEISIPRGTLIIRCCLVALGTEVNAAVPPCLVS